MNSIELHHLSYSYNLGQEQVTTVLNDINLSIIEGDFVAIMGASGSGKSTLLHLMGGMLSLQSGQVIIEQQNLSQYNANELANLRNKKLGFVFQQFYLMPNLTVADNIKLASQFPLAKLKDNKAIDRRVLNLAKELGISHRLTHLPNALSGGEKQRVVVARALFNGANIILADEPSGNLDSHNTQALLSLLKSLNDQGKTVVIVTHDPDVAAVAKRHVHMEDGRITLDQRMNNEQADNVSISQQKTNQQSEKTGCLNYIKQLIIFAWRNLHRKKSASLLTALGVSIGIAAILIMMSLGQFAKEQILASYNKLGATTVSFYGAPNWQQQAVDKVPIKFNGFSIKDDLQTITRIFPQISSMTPILNGNGQASYGGQVSQQQGPILGVNQFYFNIIGKQAIIGHAFTAFDVQQAMPVCVIGYGLWQRFFANSNPLNKILYFSQNQNLGHCNIIGVMPKQTSQNNFSDKNFEIVLPYRFYKQIAPWYRQFIFQFLVQVPHIDQIKPTGQAIKAFFSSKYGKSGTFEIDPQTELLSNMRMFLNIFTLLLASISIVSLIVAGIGITNMMLAAIADRLHEIGLYKAIGATDHDMACIALTESILLSVIAGVLGLVVGFIIYELIIYLGSVWVKSIPFVWLFSALAMGLAISSMLLIGILSGLMPAKKARSLDIVSCLNQ